MFTKRLPWKAAETLDAVLQHINTPPEKIQNLLPELDPQIAETIMKGLELYPQDRWQTMDEMLEPLKEAYRINQQRTKAKPERGVTPSTQPRKSPSHSASKSSKKKTPADKTASRAKRSRDSNKPIKAPDSVKRKQEQSSPGEEPPTCPPPKKNNLRMLP